MRIFTSLLLLAALCLSHLALAQPLDELVYLSEDAPPINYYDQGVFKGIAVDLLEQTTAAAGAPVTRTQVQVKPWARAYREALRGPKRVIFAIYRTPEREHLFKWAGPFNKSELVLVAKKRRHITLKDLGALNQYVVGAQREDAAEIHLRNLDLENMAITYTVNPLLLARMMMSDRIDIWAGGLHGIFAHLNQAGANPNEYEVIGTLHQADLYFAFSRDVSDGTVQRFQQALERVLNYQPVNISNRSN
ncbi:transporter substrate-binding domain-containing protein [Simiduia sp. 21SJ11W-1]|uniref:substrate-binding periplasmic protein n=1 Tax=Simiduia sp. 21SJ11W-1 TaxID=2909669 RepID=UPI00209EC3E3|nr:transporter substrate-binding domain-containing protein [Simiduia sp. 21SJ11W-1]UTA47065.1 transporter substrate-binding domain-containing protein [Simiduia sp. 21SJ11W-1]